MHTLSDGERVLFQAVVTSSQASLVVPLVYTASQILPLRPITSKAGAV